MTTKFNVRLDPPFQTGALNEDFFIDLPHMNDEQKKALAKFIEKTTNGDPLPGKNKPSHLDDNLGKIPQTDLYEEGNYWHYHCGPSYSNPTNPSLTFNLGINLNGATSAEVIHYIKSKENEDDITIVAYSPKHTPFPNSDSEDNPLFCDADEE